MSRASNARRLGNMLLGQAHGMRDHRSYQSPDFEEQVSYEQVRHLSKVAGISHEQAANVLKAGVGTMNLPKEAPIAGNVRSAAQFSINVARPTAAIVGTKLPFVVFGPLDIQNGYRQIITGLLPAGVALTSVTIGEVSGKPNDCTFTYTAAGPLVDSVVVTCGTMAYPSLMISLITDLILSTKLRITLSDAAQTAQFNETLNANTRNMFGSNHQNPITPADYKSPEQFQQGIVDLDVDYKFDKETMLVSNILAVAGFSINYSLNIAQFFRQSARNWAT